MDASPDGEVDGNRSSLMPADRKPQEHNIIMSTKYPITDRIDRIRTAWRELAPDVAFGGMSLAQLEEATEGPLEARRELSQLERATEAARVARDQADVETGRLLEFVVDAVKGTPGFGQDCALYRAFGYVRKSERRTGLTRKRKTASATAEPPSPADATGVA